MTERITKGAAAVGVLFCLLYAAGGLRYLGAGTLSPVQGLMQVFTGVVLAVALIKSIK